MSGSRLRGLWRYPSPFHAQPTIVDVWEARDDDSIVVTNRTSDVPPWARGTAESAEIWRIIPGDRIVHLRRNADGTYAVCGFLEIDLTEPVPPDAVARLGGQGMGPTLAVLTACDPYGRVMDYLWNERLTQVLWMEVATGGRAWVPADGASRDGTHREAGVAVSMPKSEARLLAVKLGQSAFFWFDGASMWIIGAVVDAPDQRLPAEASPRMVAD